MLGTWRTNAMQGPDRSPGMAPLVVQDPYWSRETGWTTIQWTWNPSTAGGYGMMAGDYSVPMAGRGLPPATGVIITVDMSRFENDAFTPNFVKNGKVIQGDPVFFKHADDKNALTSIGGCPEGMNCDYRGGKMLVYDPVTGQLVDQVDLNTIALIIAIEKYAEASVVAAISIASGELTALAATRLLGFLAGRFVAAQIQQITVLGRNPAYLQLGEHCKFRVFCGSRNNIL